RSGRVDAVACGARAGRGCRSYSLPRAPPWVVYVGIAPAPASARNAAGSWVSSARLRAPLVMAMDRQSVSWQTYAPRPARRPVGSNTTSPVGVRTIRRRSRLARDVRHETHAPAGHRATA